MDGGFVFLVLLIVVVVIGFSINHSKQVNSAWSQAARSLRLLHDPGGFLAGHRITGTIDGHRVMVDTHTRGSGKSSRTYTRYRVSYPRSLELGMNLSKQGFFSGIAKALGAQDIRVGDPGFDALVVVKGANSAEVLRFLTPNRRSRIRDAMARFEELEIDDFGIQTESAGRESHAHVLIRRVRHLVELAQSLMDENVPAATALPKTPKPAFIPKARAATAPMPAPLPESKTGPTPMVPPEPEPTPSYETCSGHEPPSLLCGTVVGQALFGGKLGTSEIERTFAAEYANRMIMGEGILRHWSPSRFDFVFGSGNFIKATVDMPLGETATYGRRGFQMVLKLPIDSPSPQIGTTCTYQGRLVKAEGLMRQLYVVCE